MKMLKIQQLLSYQDHHDSTYQYDRYNRDVIDKLKHFNLHITKYFTKLVPYTENQSLTNTIIETIWIDTMLISLSMANTLNVLVPDVNLIDGIYTDKSYKDLVNKSFSSTLYTLCKSLDAYDHIENYDIRLKLTESIKDLFILIQMYIHLSGSKFFEARMNARYQFIRDKFLL